jgi:hypothetical protein
LGSLGRAVWTKMPVLHCKVNGTSFVRQRSRRYLLGVRPSSSRTDSTKTPMTERDPERDAERLPEEAARQLLKRASELEASRVVEVSVAELRSAAREAGIGNGAFEQALAELRARDIAQSAVATAVPRGRLARFRPAALILGSIVLLLFLRAIFPGP